MPLAALDSDLTLFEVDADAAGPLCLAWPFVVECSALSFCSRVSKLLFNTCSKLVTPSSGLTAY